MIIVVPQNKASAFSELRESRGIPESGRVLIQSLCRRWRPARDGQGSFTRSSGAGYGGNCRRAIASASSRPVRGKRVECDPLECLATNNRQSCSKASGGDRRSARIEAHADLI